MENKNAGMQESKKQDPIQSIITIIILVGLAWYFFGGGLEKQVASDMQSIHNKVANDAVDQYQIAKRNGSRIDICVQAGLVAASYLQAKDETNYRRWKNTEEMDCKSAGLRR